MNIYEFLNTIGYDTGGIVDFFPYINEWKAWYKGKLEEFHNYSIYNGNNEIQMQRLSLQICKFISEKMADLLYNENVKITLGKDEDTQKLDEILTENRFQQLMNRGIEKAFAMGTGAVVADINNINIDGELIDFEDSEVRLSFVNAENMFPLTWDNKGIRELCITEYVSSLEGNKCVVKLHVKDDTTGNYHIKSYVLDVDVNGQIQYNANSPTIDFDTKNNIPWFAIIMPNIVNNIDLYSPYGISIYANSIDTIKSVDIAFDSFVNEIQLGRKRLFVTKEVLKFLSNGEQKLNFDTRDIIFYCMGDGFNDENNAKNYVQEVNGELRIEQHVKAISTLLRVLGSKIGFGADYLSFDQQSMSPKTATEVISQNSDMYRTICKHKQVLKDSVMSIIEVIAYIGELTGKYSLDISYTNIDFDDSIIENKEQERETDRKDLENKTYSRLDYIMKWRGLDEQSALEKIIIIDNDDLDEKTEDSEEEIVQTTENEEDTENKDNKEDKKTYKTQKNQTIREKIQNG